MVIVGVTDIVLFSVIVVPDLDTVAPVADILLGAVAEPVDIVFDAVDA